MRKDIYTQQRAIGYVLFVLRIYIPYNPRRADNSWSHSTVRPTGTNIYDVWSCSCRAFRHATCLLGWPTAMFLLLYATALGRTATLWPRWLVNVCDCCCCCCCCVVCLNHEQHLFELFLVVGIVDVVVGGAIVIIVVVCTINREK